MYLIWQNPSKAVSATRTWPSTGPWAAPCRARAARPTPWPSTWTARRALCRANASSPNPTSSANPKRRSRSQSKAALTRPRIQERAHIHKNSPVLRLSERAPLEKLRARFKWWTLWELGYEFAKCGYNQLCVTKCVQNSQDLLLVKLKLEIGRYFGQYTL